MKSGPLYSRIIAGTMSWGSWGKQLTTNEMANLMRQCLENGITSFDHADIYGDYENEMAFGSAFTSSGIDRSSIQLISKCGIQMTRGRTNKVKHYEYGKEYVIWSAEESLRKLQTDYLDLFLLHRPSPLMQPEEIGEAIEVLQKAGKIRAFGVSNFTPSQIALLETAVPVFGNQIAYSLNHTDPMYDGTLDDCIIHDHMAMAWSPLGDFFKEKNAQNVRIAKLLGDLCPKYNATESQLLLAFILKHPAKVHPVVGTTNLERLIAAHAAINIELELEDWFLLLEASAGNRVP